LKKIILSGIIVSLLLVGCSGTNTNLLNSNSIEVTNKTTNSIDNIRPEIKADIDNLKEYKIVDIEHITKGIEEPQRFAPTTPKEFNAGMFKIAFRKLQQNDNRTSLDQVSVVCQTESKVGHLAKVIPGKTEVDGYIFYAGNTNRSEITKLIYDNPNLKFTKNEERYFIENLYGRFAKKMTLTQANAVNATKDIALAIYFNGNEGIEQFVQEQKDILKNEQ
jgi:hypothetical protein